MTTRTREASSSAPGPRERGLVRSSGVMALGTGLSRITGFLRTVVLAGALGTGLLADTYNVAHALPTAVYFLLLGGVLNSVFVPQLVRAMADSDDDGKGYADRLITLCGLILLVVAAVATLATPLIVRIYAQDLTEVDYSVAFAFAYWSLPQLFFYGVFTILGEFLNARGRFGPMMWAPIANNVVVIASGLLFLVVADVQRSGSGATASIDGGEIALLGAGSLLGVVVQTAVLVPPLRRSGYRYSPRLDFRGFGLGRAARLAQWTLLLVVVNQLAYVVVTRIGTAVSAGARDLDYGVGFTAYQSAYLIFLLPHGVIAVSVVTALLPRMSRAAHDGRLGDLRSDISSGLRLCAVAVVPAAVAFVALGREIAEVLYASAGARSASFIGLVLVALAPGLIFYTAHFLALRGFYAQEDTRTPFLISLWITSLHVGLAVVGYLLLDPEIVTIAIGASYTIAYVVGATASLRMLGRRIGGIDARRVLGTYLRLLAAASVAGVPAFFAARGISTVLGNGLSSSLLAVTVGGALLLGGYLLLARRLHVDELDTLVESLRGRFGRSSATS